MQAVQYVSRFARAGNMLRKLAAFFGRAHSVPYCYTTGEPATDLALAVLDRYEQPVVKTKEYRSAEA